MLSLLGGGAMFSLSFFSFFKKRSKERGEKIKREIYEIIGKTERYGASAQIIFPAPLPEKKQSIFSIFNGKKRGEGAEKIIWAGGNEYLVFSGEKNLSISFAGGARRKKKRFSYRAIFDR